MVTRITPEAPAPAVRSTLAAPASELLPAVFPAPSPLPPAPITKVAEPATPRLAPPQARLGALGLATRVRGASQEIRALLDGITTPSEQRRILEILRRADDAALDGILAQVDLDQLLTDLWDYPFFAHYNTDLIELITTRVPALSIEVRAKWIDALQRGWTDAADERAITAVFLATQGSDLTQLKNLNEAGDDERDLQELLYHDIDDEALRQQILAHFAREAENSEPRTRVLSDIDDTAFSSINDPRVPKGILYPGLVAFYEALATGEQPAFLSARPWEPTGWLERYTHDALRAKGVPAHSMIGGDVLHWFGHARQAAKKIENFDVYRQLFPEYRFVFIGDSGQGDAAAGEAMLAENSDRLSDVFIHNLGNVAAPAKLDDPTAGLHYFDNYVDAGIIALQRRMITEEGLRRIIESVQSASLTDFSPAYVERLHADLQRAQAYLSAAIV